MSSAVLLGFLFVLAVPAVVFADDSQPAEEVNDPAPAEQPAAKNTEQSAPVEGVADADAEPEMEASEPAEDAVPHEADGGDAAPAEEPAAEEETMAEALAGMPEDTQIVVLDEEGGELPLACEQALEMMAESDPIWCPAGVMPGGAGCTAAVATMTDLFPLLAEKSGAGTIYFTTTYNTNDMVLDQAVNENLYNLTNLTLQGGWNGSIANPSILDGDGNPEQTEFGVPITINWNYDVTLNDLFVQPGWDYRLGNAITVTQNNPEADVTLDHVEGHLAEKGVMISGGHDVTISDSNFGGNYGRGIDVRSVNGTFTLRDSSSSGSSDSGLALQTIKNVIIDNAVISGNNQNRYNAYLGHFSNIIYDAENITITDSVFNNNNWWGLVIQYGEYYLWEFDTARTYTLDTLTINGSEFLGNNRSGLIVDGWYMDENEDYQYSGIVDINAIRTNNGQQNAIFSLNQEAGVEIFGSDKLDIDGAVFNDNGGTGLSTSTVDEIDIADAVFMGNNYGATFYNSVSVNLNGTSAKPIIVNDNNGKGIEFESESTDVSIYINYLKATDNSDTGVRLVYYFADATIKNSEFSENSGHGLSLFGLTGDLTISDSSFNNNDAFGVDVYTIDAMDVTLKNISAEGNSIGAKITTKGNLDYLCSLSENNDNNDLEFDLYGNLRLQGPDWANEDEHDEEVGIYRNTYFFFGGDYIYLGACGAGTCCAASGDTAAPVGGRTVQVSGGEQVGLGCDVPWTALQLPNQDKASFTGMCGAGMNATLKEVGRAELPGALPAGMSFGKSLVTAIAGQGSELSAGSQTITFTVPEELQGSDLAILFWDAEAGVWVEITADNIVLNADGSVSATVNFTGTFVLAGR